MEVAPPTRVYDPGGTCMYGSLEEAVPVTRVFDPGKCNVYNVSSFHILNLLVPQHRTLPPMHRSGNVIVNEQSYIIDECLFDSGAESDNFISQTFIDKNHVIFADSISNHNSVIRLSDSKTTVNITQIVTLNVAFIDTNFVTHNALLNFNIMPITHIDMIIGINSILYFLYDFYLDMLRTAKNNIKKYNTPTPSPHLLTYTPICISNTIPTHPDYHDCVPTWPDELDEIALEELEIPDPVNFSKALYLLSNTRTDILNTYYALLLTNINPDMVAACPQILTFMKGPIALKVFCPEVWTGIKGIPPLKLEFRSDIPARHRPAIRPVKPALLANAKIEFDRLCEYMYVKSDSPIASPLVIAPKPTPPFQRWCGDYVWLNQYIIYIQHWIPIVFNELEKAAEGKVFSDLDAKHAFHQIILEEATSRMLSILTPWGCVRPEFLPEGISSATAILHTIMTEILEDMLDTCIVIFDNFLIVCDSFDDCYKKLVKFLTICADRNVILGMAKSKIGWESCVFFGYQIEKGTYQLTQSRKDAVASLVFPTTVKQVQSFLGSTVFFRNNIDNFAQKSAPLNDMTKKGFSWDEGTWLQDYRAIFDAFKSDILNAFAVKFPDYGRTFIMRTDASNVAWGGVLLQVTEGGEYECISLASAKFTDTARKWDIQKKETYAIVASIKAMQYILTGKFFIIETDNKNITYLNSDSSSICNRWKLYIQSFHTCIRFLQGKFNTSDWLTRQYHLYNLYTNIIDNADGPISSLNNIIPNMNVNTDINEFCDNVLWLLTQVSSDVETPGRDDELYVSTEDPIQVCTDLYVSTEEPIQESSNLCVSTVLSIKELFDSVHGGRNFHRGVLQTYKDLNEKYPGHNVSIQVIRDMVAECPVCQKVRISMNYTLPEENLHLKPAYYRQRIGIDTLTITPQDHNGNIACICVVEHFSKFVGLYPVKDHSAESLALACFLHYTRFGRFDDIYSDPGSDLTSETIRILNKWLGQKHKVSLAERHESNGVEPTNKKVLGLARTLIHDERIAHKWSDDIVISLIQHHCNSMFHRETGFSAFELKFGSLDKSYMMLPDSDVIDSNAPDVLRRLNENLKDIRDISHKWQQDLVQKRDNSKDTLNKYQAGDYVLFLYSVDNERVNKLDARFLGPYKVISHVHNEVIVRNLITDAISTFHCTRVKPFIGSPEEAKEAALRDADQYYIDEFIAYKGDPLVRSSMIFYIKFADGCYHWMPWSKDLFDTQQYELFCNSHPELSPLVLMHKESLTIQRAINKTPIRSVEPGNNIYMDLRAIGAGLYESLDLPDSDFTRYVVLLEYTGWQNVEHTRINCIIPALQIQWSGRSAVNHTFVQWWGACKEVSENMIFLNNDLIRKYNIIQIIKNNN